MVEAYQGYIEKIGRLAGSVSCPVLALDNMLRSMISQLDKEYLKPVSLKKIMDLAKDELIKLSGEDHYERLEFCLAVGQISN